MAKPGKLLSLGELGGSGDMDKGDIRLALKMPARGSLQDRQVANAFKKVRQALQSSSGGTKRRGLSTRQRGAGNSPVRSQPAARGSAPATQKPLQRVAVRWTYAKNKGDGQWGAHGKYIERESAQEQELDKAQGLDDPEQERQAESLEQTTPQTQKENTHERADRDSAPDTERNAGRLAILRESYRREIGRKPAAKSINALRSLSSVPVVRWQGRGQVLLQGDAPHNVVGRGNPGDDRLRRIRNGDGGPTAGRRIKPASSVVGFGSEGDSMRISETLDRWQKGGDEHMFKLIVSPEFGDKLDLKRHVKELMGQMEKDLGTKLQWVAIDHHNTDNPHVHVAVRGLDDRGQKLEVSPVYIKEGSRVRAQEAATRQLGYRSDLDVTEALERQVSQQRFTEIDRGLLKKAVNREISFEGMPPANEKARDTRLRQIRRLAQLEAMGLAARIDSKSWRLSPSLESALRQMQVSQDRLKTKFSHREMISDPSAPLVVTELQTVGQRVSGRVVGAGMNEATNRPYLMVEGFDGKVHYLNQTPKIQKMRGDGSLKAGDYLSLEVIQRKDVSGHVIGSMVRAEGYGRTMAPELLDRELMRGRVANPITVKKTVAGAFLDAAAARLKRLQDAGAVTVEAGQVRAASSLAYDRVRFEDSGIRATEYAGGAAVANVLQKGRASIAFEAANGQRLIVTGAQLEAMGLEQKFVGKGSMVFFGVDAKGKAMASVVKQEKLPDLIADPRTNKLDLLAQQLGPLPTSHPLASAMQQRTEVWKKRGVNIRAADFGRDAAVWRKNMEQAASADLATVVNARKLNRLDWMLQQAYQPTTAPLEKALHMRAEVWKQRGVDPMDSKFALKANTWRKNVELHEAAAEKGVEKVLDELSQEKGKPVRELASEPGRQVSGRVVLVQNESDQSSVVIDSGRELTVLRQPAPAPADLKAGQRVRARAEEVIQSNTRQRMMMWRFADLEREKARHKGQGREHKLF